MKKWFNDYNRYILDGFLIGIVAGGFAVFYRWVLSQLEHMRHFLFSQRNIGMILAVIALALFLSFVVAKLLKWAPLSGGSGIPQIHGEVLGLFDAPAIPVAVSKMVGGMATSLLGFSLGREGPSIQLGGAVAKQLSKVMHNNPTEEKYFLTAGAAAGLSAAFSAPISGVLFVLEEIHRYFSKTVVMMSLVAAVVADVIATYLFDLKPVFSFHVENVLSHKYFGHVIILGIIIGLAGALFNQGILKGQDFIRKYFPKNPYYKMALVFLCVVAIGFLFPDVLGGGHDLIESLEHTYYPLTMLIALFAIKGLFTFFSYGSGVQGGIFLPTLVVGGLLGICYFRVIELFGMVDDSVLTNFIILSQAAMLTAVVRSPILSIVLVMEMNGNINHLLGLSLISVVAFFTADFVRSEPIYESLLTRLLDRAPSMNREDHILRFEWIIPLDSDLIGKTLAEVDIPNDVIIVSIERCGESFVPHGATKLQPHDHLEIVTNETKRAAAQQYFQSYSHEVGHDK